MEKESDCPQLAEKTLDPGAAPETFALGESIDFFSGVVESERSTHSAKRRR
jgi:hypothetical protein